MIDMDIVKNLKDYNLSAAQKRFADYYKNELSSYFCSEKITNPEFIRQYVAPANDLLIYNYSKPCAEPSRLLKRTS